MSSLFALLDDVAAIAKVAAASLDDVAAQAAKAGTKAAVLVIDDAAVTPQYVQGFSAKRELPIVWRIAKGSIRNKLLILLPVGLLLSAFAPWAITPLLMIGGGYLCFEGAEKILHKLAHKSAKPSPEAMPPSETRQPDAARLEEQKVAGAIKTDFILSAEIMTVSLATIADGSIWIQTLALIGVAIGITALVYGGVAVIVKADDVGILMARSGRLAMTRKAGAWIVRSMPAFLVGLTVVGTVAMLWVGGSILIHGLDVLGFGWFSHLVETASETAAGFVGVATGFAKWLVKAVLDGVFGVIAGMAIVPLATKVFTPLWARIPKLK